MYVPINCYKCDKHPNMRQETAKNLSPVLSRPIFLCIKNVYASSNMAIEFRSLWGCGVNAVLKTVSMLGRCRVAGDKAVA